MKSTSPVTIYHAHNDVDDDRLRITLYGHLCSCNESNKIVRRGRLPILNERERERERIPTKLATKE
jgi:hypothetical protein